MKLLTRPPTTEELALGPLPGVSVGHGVVFRQVFREGRVRLEDLAYPACRTPDPGRGITAETIEAMRHDAVAQLTTRGLLTSTHGVLEVAPGWEDVVRRARGF